MNIYGRRVSVPSSATLTSPSALPSPSVVAARAYFLEHTPSTGENSNALHRHKSLLEAQEFPRRHSVFPTSGGLEMNASFMVSSPSQNPEAMPETTEVGPEVKIEPSDDVPMTERKQNDMVKVTAIAAARPSETFDCPVTPVSDMVRQVPFQYTHDRLRDWGYVYLGNTATADAFINAVGLRRPSLALVKEDITQDRPESTTMVTIRARVLPKANERKPFLIQRQFDIEELRASIPAVQRRNERPSIPLRRSNRIRRSSTQLRSNSPPGGIPKGLGYNASRLGSGAVPIRK